jgi:hypothetical protein
VSLSAENKLLLLRAIWGVIGASVMVRVVDYRKLAANLESRPTGSRQLSTPQNIKWLFEAVSRRIPGAHCLIQSYAAVCLFREYGYPAHMKLGVAKAEGKFSAHAWVELDGRIVIGGGDSVTRFTPFGVAER